MIPHGAKCLQPGDLCRVRRGDDERHAVGQVLDLRHPADLVQLVGVRGNHSLDCLERAPLARDGDIDAVGEGVFVGHRPRARTGG